MEDLFRAQGVYDFHKFIRHQMMEQKEIQEDTIFQRNPSLVIVSDEVGYGVVPVDSFERAWREKVGRVCTYLAANSTRVVRVVCGIGTVIKEETLKSEILKEEI
jgi:adenosylcobinamide kinase/adenosylcobinamide-phosphate guanylyltransferase